MDEDTMLVLKRIERSLEDERLEKMNEKCLQLLSFCLAWSLALRKS